ncbi:hypothetical protein [Anaerocolumna chitinilytica]|nr:hypothetical protein [Anaerocolumna chitinilytica]
MLSDKTLLPVTGCLYEEKKKERGSLDSKHSVSRYYRQTTNLKIVDH